MTRRYWMYAPGEQANRWEEFRSTGVMALDYGVGDLRSYKTEADLTLSFQSAASDDTSHKNDVRALMDFRDKMKPGDLVFAKKGQKKIVGVGRVTGDYEFSASTSDMRHRRRVEWFDSRERALNDKAAIKTLTDISNYPTYLVKLADAYDIDDLYAESQYRVWDEALQKWPIEKLKIMSLEEYNTIGSKTSFCYFIEKILEDMGSVWGGSSYKFGIFEYNKNDPKPLDVGASGDEKYRWYSKYGATAVEAFETVRTRIVAIAESSAHANYSAIDDIDFSPAIKWKIAFLYQNRESMGIVDIFKKEMMMQAVGETNVDTAMSQLYARALTRMPNVRDVFVWARQAWRKIGEEKEMSEELKRYKEYLEKQSQGAGTVSSYVTVIRKIGAIVNKVSGYEYVPEDFSSIRNLDLLWKIYQLVKAEQGKSDGGFFKNSTLTKAYWDSRHGFCSAAIRKFIDFRVETYDGIPPSLSFETEGQESLQRITYGAPGTGKSYGIEEKLKQCPDRVFRTTFHPDSDYSTFVGAYKPTMEVMPRLALVGTKLEKVSFGSGFTEAEKSELSSEKKIVYKFVEQAFTKAYVKAWKALDAARKAGEDAVPESIYLVIEEINRGNCAQVFGDIFQLLDRENGFSKYPIKADEDLRRHLAVAFDGLDFGTQYKTVQTGEDLVLPGNLYIWATMNTSDQSLFPMDSAFKRRWDWEYVPIRDGGKGWTIDVVETKKEDDGKETTVTMKYDWWKFLEAINAKIFKLTDSEDKKLGYYFAKAENGTSISAKTFVGKVIFYLWNDVYKDYGIAEIFKGEQNGMMGEGEKEKGVPFEAFFGADGKTVNPTTLKNFFKAVGVEPKA